MTFSASSYAFFVMAFKSLDQFFHLTLPSVPVAHENCPLCLTTSYAPDGNIPLFILFTMRCAIISISSTEFPDSAYITLATKSVFSSTFCCAGLSDLLPSSTGFDVFSS